MPATINTTNENSVFPNPITGSTFNVLLAGKLSGNYSVRITDLAGRAVQNTKATVSKGQQVQQINFNVRPTAGTYLVKILDEKASKFYLTN